MSHTILDHNHSNPENPGFSISYPILWTLGLFTGAAWTLFLGLSMNQQVAELKATPVLTAPQGATNFRVFLPTATIIILMLLLLLAGRWALRSPSHSWKKLKQFTLSAILGSIISIIIPILILWVNIDTEYASGYSESSFKSISVGDSEQKVLDLLGDPISITKLKPYQAEGSAREIYNYTRSPSSSHYRLRRIWFDEQGNVTRIQREMYWD